MTHTDLIKGDTMTENWNPEPFEGTWTEAARHITLANAAAEREFQDWVGRTGDCPCGEFDPGLCPEHDRERWIAQWLAECWRWHHDCAVNRIQRVRELCERSRVAMSRGCTCYTNECSGCGYGTPLAWDLDPVEVLAVLDEICT